jgi:hypothetical protein
MTAFRSGKDNIRHSCSCAAMAGADPIADVHRYKSLRRDLPLVKLSGFEAQLPQLLESSIMDFYLDVHRVTKRWGKCKWLNVLHLFAGIRVAARRPALRALAGRDTAATVATTSDHTPHLHTQPPRPPPDLAAVEAAAAGSVAARQSPVGRVVVRQRGTHRNKYRRLRRFGKMLRA